MSCESMTWADAWKQLGTWMTTTGIKLVVAIILCIIAFVIINFISKKINKQLEKKAKQKNIDKTISKTVATIIRVSLKFLVVIGLVAYVGINTSAITAVIASSGLGIGLAINGVLSNFAGGLILLITRPFKIDDFIKIDDGGYITEGFVEEIKIYNTKIKTYDNRTVYIPNGKLSTQIIENYTEKGLRRLDIPFSISYKADYVKAQEIIKDLCDKNEKILQAPPLSINMTAHSTSSIEITCKAWLNPHDYWDVKFYLLENVKKEFDAQGIEIPYPQMDVHIKNDTPIEISEIEKN